MKLHIDYDFMGWNDYIRAERANKYKANHIKQDEKAFIVFSVKEKYTGRYPVTLTIRPHFKDKRRDLDNFRMKGLIDGLVSAGVIKNDNLSNINKIILEPIIDGGRGVEVEINESGFEVYTIHDFVQGLTVEEREKLNKFLRENF